MSWIREGRRQGGSEGGRDVARGFVRRLACWGATAVVGLAWATPATADVVLDAGHGPVTVRVPESYDGSRPLPLVVLLHPFGTNGELTEAYFHGLTSLAESQEFFLVAPDAPHAWMGIRYWRSMTWETEDSAYLRDLIEGAMQALAVDEGAISVVGHSSGAVMGYRLASDHPDLVSAVVSLSGAMIHPFVGFRPTAPVHALEIHGTADEILPYGGSLLTLGAEETVSAWAAASGCEQVEELVPDPLDLDIWIQGAETDVVRWTSGCTGGSAELWTIEGAGHVPIPSAELSQEIVRWLGEHHREAGVP